MGLEFDAWQDGLNRLLLSKRVDGLYACDTFAMSITRQTGKTYDLGAVCFALCIKYPELTVIWTAHHARTSGETFKAMQALALRDKVAPHILTVAKGKGTEAVIFNNGSRILFGAREHGFGRGFAGVDVLIFDEAQILTERAMDDMVPATNVSRNPLIILAGTPPKPTDPGEVFTRYRANAISGEVDDVGFVEISADPDADPLDRDSEGRIGHGGQWRKMNPSHPHRTSIRAILRMFKALSLDSFKREAMGIWDEFSKHEPVISATRWRELADVGPDAKIEPDALGVDMSHARDISINACWLEGEPGADSAHTEQVWAGIDTVAAVDWIAAKAGRRMPVVIDAQSPANSMVEDLRAKRVNVKVTTANQMAKACGAILNRSKAGTLSHANQEPVNDAVEAGRKRPIGNAGGWGWDRSDPESPPIHPIVGTTLALFGATENPRRGRGGAGFG